MHEDLLGYLLGALEPDEQRRVEEALARDPRLRQELERLRQCVAPLEELRGGPDAAPSLVDRVCAAVEAHPRPAPSRGSGRLWGVPIETLVPSSYHSISDAVVVAIVALAAFTLFLPALANSRFESRKAACQDHLRELGGQLISFSLLQPDQRFPLVPMAGNRSFAGIFAPALLESHLLSRYSSLLICPGSELAAQPETHAVPSFEELDAAQGDWLWELQRRAGGSYAYNVGFVVDDQAHAPRNRGRSHFALLADSPSLHLPHRQSAHHGGLGQNILFEDGRVAFVTDVREVRGDDPLRNHDGFAEAARDANDAVVLPSEMRPIILEKEAICPIELLR